MAERATVARKKPPSPPTDPTATWKAKDFTTCIETVRPCLAAPSNPFPILSHFAFSETGILAYNDEQGIEAICATPLRCAVPGDLLAKVLASVPDDDQIVLAWAENDLTLTHGGGRSRVNLATQQPAPPMPPMPPWGESVVEDYQAMAGEPPHTVVTLTPVVRDGLARCLLSVPAKPRFAYERVITFEETADAIAAYATDNVVITRWLVPKAEHPVGTLATNSLRVFLPTGFVEQLVAVTRAWPTICGDSTPPPASALCAIGPSFALARWGRKVRLFSRILADVQPYDFHGVLDPILPNGTQASVPIPPRWEAAMDRAVTLQPGRQTPWVDLTIKGDELHMATESDSHHRMHETCSLPTAQPALPTMRANPTVLTRVSAGAERVLFADAYLILFAPQTMHFVAHLS